MDSHTRTSPALVIDCASCAMEGTVACQDCVVTYLLAPDGPLHLDDDERSALSALAEEGLVPGLRLVPRRAAG